MSGSIIFGGFISRIGEASLSPAARALVAHFRAMFTGSVLDRLSNISVTEQGETLEVLHFQTGCDHFVIVLTNGVITDNRRREYIPNFYDDGGTRIGGWEPVESHFLFYNMTDMAVRSLHNLDAWRDASSEWEWLTIAEQINEQIERDEERDFLLEQTWDTDRYDALSPAAWDRLGSLS